MSEITAILKLLTAHPGTSAVLATLVRVDGSSYRQPGARRLWLPDGTCTGSISGGCLEEDLLVRAQRVLATGRAEVATYDTAAENDVVWGTGTGCDGRVQVLLELIPPDRPSWLALLHTNLFAQNITTLAVVYSGPPGTKLGTRLASDPLPRTAGSEIFLETIQPPHPLVVFGAGDDAQPLVRMALELGWQVTVVDSRSAYATAARFPGAAVLVSPAEATIRPVPLGPRMLAVVMSHRFRDDIALLPQLLSAPLAYLGLLGTRQRTQRLLASIEGAGLRITAEMRQQLHAPVGLDLGGRTPETVALAILAEIQARLAGRTPGFLRERPPGPIHD